MLLEVSDLAIDLSTPDGPQRVVDGGAFALDEGESLGVVGESGSGKSTLARAILRLINATAGSVRFEGVELLGIDADTLKGIRRRMQVIFQDPYASLNPRMTAGENIGEGLLLLGGGSRATRAHARSISIRRRHSLAIKRRRSAP